MHTQSQSKIGQRNVVEIKEKGLTRQRTDRGKDYTTRHRFHYVNHAARKLLATGVNARGRAACPEREWDPRSGTWGRTPATRLNQWGSTKTPGGIKRRDPNVRVCKTYQQIGRASC